MTSGATAADQLQRILYVLPAAVREGGASLEELADRLDVTEERVLRDLQEVTARSFYQRPGQAERLQIAVDGGRVSVWTAGEFQRPVRLSPREVLALDLALRARAIASDDGDGAGAAEDDDGADASVTGVSPGGSEATIALARRLEAELAVTAEDDDLSERLAVEGQAADDRADRVLGTLFRAAGERRRCRIRYLASGAAEPAWREVEPYIMVRADGRWYAVSRCRDVEGIRFFRADRVLEAEPGDATFEVPDGFDVAEFLDDGHLYQPRNDVEVTVRYGSRVARWVRERGPVEEHEDGSVEVTHSVSDLDWIVRHVLRYGPEAEVVDPPAVRRRVAGAARRIAD